MGKKLKFFVCASVSITTLLSQFLYSQKKTYGVLIRERLSHYSVINTVNNMSIPEIQSQSCFATWTDFVIKQIGDTGLIVDVITLNKLDDFQATERVGKWKSRLEYLCIGVNFYTKYYYADSEQERRQAWRDLGWDLTKEATEEVVKWLVGSPAALPVMFVSYIIDEAYSTIVGGYQEKVWEQYEKYYAEQLLGRNINKLKQKMIDGTLVSFMTSDEEMRFAYTGFGYDSAVYRQMAPNLYKRFMQVYRDTFVTVAERASKEIAKQKQREAERQLKEELERFKNKLFKQKISFKGIVKDAVTGKPIKKVVVKNESSGDTFYTNDNGEFNFSIGLFYVYTDNSVVLIVSEENYLPKKVRVENLKAEGNPDVVIELEPVSGIIKGIVTDKTTDKPVERAKLELSGVGLVRTTNNNGEYVFEKVAPGDYEISVSKEGYEPQTVEVSLSLQEGKNKIPSVVKNIKLSPAKVVVRGIVLDAEDRNPLDKAKVRISYKNQETLTNSYGEYSFTDIVPGEYRISAVKIGYKENSVSVSVPQQKNNEPVEVCVSELLLEKAKTEVKFVSPTNGAIIENLRPSIKAVVRVEDGQVIPVSNIKFTFNGSNETFEYNSETGDLIYTPAEELKETPENFGKHTAKIEVMLPQLGTNKPPQVLQDTLNFVAGKRPTISQFVYNNKYFEDPSKNPLLIGFVSDEGSGVDINSIVLSVDGENVSVDVLPSADGKNVQIFYTPKSSLSGGKHTARLFVKDLAGFHTSESVEFTIEGAVLSVLKDSIIIDDSEGNGNGKIDAGETVTLIFNIQNAGTISAESVNAVIYSDTKYINIDQPKCEYGTILPNTIGYPQGSYNSYVLTALNIGQAEKTEPIVVPVNVVIRDKNMTSWNDSFNLTIYPMFFVSLDRLPEPVLDRVQTITGIVSDPKVKTAMLNLNGEVTTIEVKPSASGMGTFAQKVSLKAEADSVNVIKVTAINDKGEKAEDSMEVKVQLPPVIIKAVLTWDTGGTDVDLWVRDPFGESIGYSHKRSAHGGWLDFDDTNGYGPETFTQEGYYPGTYTIWVHYFSDHDDENAISTAWQVVVTLFEGTKYEKVAVYSGVLGDTGDSSTVAIIEIPPAGTKSSVIATSFNSSYEAVLMPVLSKEYLNSSSLPPKNK